MEQFTIQFNNCLYTGTLFTSRDRFPYYYWYYFEDTELAKVVGECIGFTEKSGDIVLTENLAQQFNPIADAVRNYILVRYYQSGAGKRQAN